MAKKNPFIVDPCPRCQSAKVAIFSVDDTKTKRAIGFFIKCKLCDYSGIVFKTELKAIKSWNKENNIENAERLRTALLRTIAIFQEEHDISAEAICGCLTMASTQIAMECFIKPDSIRRKT